VGAPNITKTVASREDFGSTEEYSDYLAGLLARNLREILWIITGNLDSMNIKELTANKIMTGILNAALVTVKSALSGGAYIVLDHNGMRINDGTKDVFIADIAGQVTMTGAKVQTAGSGQRIELNSGDNLLKAVDDSGDTISIKPYASGNPSIEFSNGSDLVAMFLGLGVFSINTNTTPTDIAISSGKGINIYPAGGYTIRIPSWSSLYSNGNGQTLQEALNNLSSSISSLSSWVSSLDSRVSALESAPPPPGP
jgi:hypothetical protein